MDLTLPLRSLVPSLDSDVLAVLGRTEAALGTTQIARLAERGSRQGVALVLERLVEHGLVHAHRTNVGHTYQLNREHLLAPLVVQALGIRDRVRELLAHEVDGLASRPLHAGVFGSFARGAGTVASDIDLLLVLPDGHDPNDPQWVEQLQALQDRVLGATGNRLELLVLSADALREAVRTHEPIVASLLDESMTLLGPELADLIQALEVAS